MSDKSRNTPRSSTRRPFRGAAGAAIAVAIAGTVALLALPALRSSAQSGGVAEFMHLHGLAVPPWAPDDVFVSSHQGLMRIGPDGAWTIVSDALHDFMGFQANPTEEGVLYSSGHPAPGTDLPNPVGFMVSADEGATWKVRSLAGQVDFHTMAVQPTDGDVIYGLSRGLMRSLDGGATWEAIDSAQLNQLGDVYALAIGPESADTLLLGAGTGLWRSEDAGRTWANLLGGAPVTAVAYRQDAVFAYIAVPGRGLTSSPDGGASWTDLNLVIEGQDAVAFIAPHPTRGDTLTVGSFGRTVYRTADAGQTWTLLANAGVPQH